MRSLLRFDDVFGSSIARILRYAVEDMPRYIPSSEYRSIKIKDKQTQALSKQSFNAFDISVLGLGNVASPAQPTDAIAAVFDLEGFTNFCKQIEPHLSVPKYLNAFLTWLMEGLRKEMHHSDQGEDVALWSPLPFFVKFLGDGLLVLWDCAAMNPSAQRNVIASMQIICGAYKSKFLPTLRATMVDPPKALRCGLARGTVFSVGEGHDYVGSCINMAARLQKLPGISFCFNVRGFDLQDPNATAFFRDAVTIRQVAIRGIGEHELVGILKSEALNLSPKDKKTFTELD